MRLDRDQYFLSGRFLDMEIAAATLRKDDVVLEAGAGHGNLTTKIAEKCRVVAIEKDAELADMIPENENIEIIVGDAVELIKDQSFSKVISNVPYSATQDILIELLKKKWELAVLVVQKEFAMKLQDRREKLQKAIEECCTMKTICEVPAEAFRPGAVDSTMILLRQNKQLDAVFWKFLCRAYRQRNRNASKVLGIKSGKKVHQMSLEELKAAYNAVSTKQTLGISTRHRK